MLPIVLAAVGGLIGGGIIAFIGWRMVIGRRISSAKTEVESLLTEAQTKYKETLLEAKEEGIKIKTINADTLKEAYRCLSDATSTG